MTLLIIILVTLLVLPLMFYIFVYNEIKPEKLFKIVEVTTLSYEGNVKEYRIRKLKCGFCFTYWDERERTGEDTYRTFCRTNSLDVAKEELKRFIKDEYDNKAVEVIKDVFKPGDDEDVMDKYPN